MVYFFFFLMVRSMVHILIMVRPMVYFLNGQVYGLMMQIYEHIFRIYVEKSIKVCNLR